MIIIKNRPQSLLWERKTSFDLFAENVHEFGAGDGFLFIKIVCKLVKLCAVCLEEGLGLFVLGFYRFNHLFVYFLLCVGRAGKGCIAAEILICHRLHGDHVEFVGHAVA